MSRLKTLATRLQPQANRIATAVPGSWRSDKATSTQRGYGYGVLFSREYRKRTAFNCLFFVCIVMPYFAIYTFLPSILQKMGLSQGFGTELLLNLLLIVGALIGIWCTVKFSRRGFLINAFIILAVTTIWASRTPASP